MEEWVEGSFEVSSPDGSGCRGTPSLLREGIDLAGLRRAPEPVIWILWDCFGACSGHRTDITRERTGYMPTDRPGPEGVYGKEGIAVPTLAMAGVHSDRAEIGPLNGVEMARIGAVH